MEINPIVGFCGKYRFLSNFYPSPITIGEFTYSNAEAAFQAQKSLDPRIRADFTHLADPKAAKSKGRRIILRADWNQIRIPIMRKVIHAKFTQNPRLRTQLLQTGAQPLIEANSWGDRFWGTDLNLHGQNHLGILLEEFRSTLHGQ